MAAGATNTVVIFIPFCFKNVFFFVFVFFKNICIVSNVIRYSVYIPVCKPFSSLAMIPFCIRIFFSSSVSIVMDNVYAKRAAIILKIRIPSNFEWFGLDDERNYMQIIIRRQIDYHHNNYYLLRTAYVVSSLLIMSHLISFNINLHSVLYFIKETDDRLKGYSLSF